MSRYVTISQSVDPNTLILEIHEEHRTRVSLLMSRVEGIALCDKLRALLADPPTVVIPGPKLAVFPKLEQQPMKVQIASGGKTDEREIGTIRLLRGFSPQLLRSPTAPEIKTSARTEATTKTE